jgi:hypothetical protein
LFLPVFKFGKIRARDVRRLGKLPLRQAAMLAEDADATRYGIG